jgi:hypothetical protein
MKDDKKERVFKEERGERGSKVRGGQLCASYVEGFELQVLEVGWVDLQRMRCECPLVR